MDKIMNMLNISGDVLIIYGLIIVMAILLVTIFIIDYKSKKRNLEVNSPIVIEGSTPIEKYETYDNLKESFNEEIKEVPPVQTQIKQEGIRETKEEPVIEHPTQTIIEESIEKSEESNIKYVEKDEEEIKEEAQAELKELVQELKEDKNENIELTDFEVEQEESAIISYNELKKVSDELYDSNEITQYDEGNEPISIAQLQEKFKEATTTTSIEVASQEEQSELLEVIESLEVPTKVEITNTVEKVEPVKETVKLDDFAIKTGDHKFKISPVISPVYGTINEEQKEIVEDFNANAKLKLEQTANLEKLDEELRKTNEFLAVLKELQKKLD